MLNREYVTELADNAIIYLLKANLSAKVGDTAHYQSNYLRSMSALTTVVSPQKVLDHYRHPSMSQSCLSLWQEVIASQSEHANRAAIIDNITQFCQFLK